LKHFYKSTFSVLGALARDGKKTMRGDQRAFLNTFNSKISQNFRELKLSREGVRTLSSDLKFSKNVYAFTQEGVAMLSGVLRSTRAV
jgi:hypothetical protein